MKKLLVLLSSYNGEKYIEQQINSILFQENVDVTIFIRDDGSTDRTLQLLFKLQKENKNIEIIKGENIGYTLSFTKLTKEAYKVRDKYDYFAFSDQDDFWLPKKLESAVLLLERESDSIPVSYISNTTLVDKNLVPLGYEHSKKMQLPSKANCLLQNKATGCTMVFNKKALELYVKNIPSYIQIHDYMIYMFCIFIG